jgi:hypothetical protein
MTTWRDRLVSAPLWVLFLYFAVGFGALTLVLPGPSSGSAARAVGGGLLFGILMTIWMSVMRRRDRDAAGDDAVSHPVAIARALRTGTAPQDRSLDQPLRGLVERRQAQLRWASRANPVVFGAFAVLAVALAVTGNAVMWFYAIADVAILVWASRSATRSSLRLANLEAELHSRADGSS